MEPLDHLTTQPQKEPSSSIDHLANTQWQGRNVVLYCSKSHQRKSEEIQSNLFEIAKALASQGAHISVVIYNSSNSNDYSLCKDFSDKRAIFETKLSYKDIHRVIKELKGTTIHIDTESREAKSLENNLQDYNIDKPNDKILEKDSTKKSSAKIKENKKSKLPPQTLNKEIICSDSTYHSAVPRIEKALKQSELFDHIAFLNPAHQDKVTLEKNEALLSKCVELIGDLAQEVVKEEGVEIKTALKKIVGLLDRYDQDENRAFQSSFILRNALLIASNQMGHPLPSWMVYTKAGKPDIEEGRVPWTFLDEWQNWVPEAQAMMLKFMEAQTIKAKALADSYPFENNSRIVLLKGGFGAGKTTLTRRLFPSQETGVIGPDMGKAVVRRALPDISHYSTFTQGSQVAYKLFNDLMNSTIGTIVYDSPLEKPEDMANYLQLCKASGRKMEIYDVARNDTARFLTVIKRDFEDDPSPISVNGVVESTIRTKVNRVNCMNVVLNDNTKGKNAPLYHFYCSDQKGVDSEEVLTLTSNEVLEYQLGIEKAKERLALEFIELGDDNKLSFFVNEATLRSHYQSILEKNVLTLSADLSNQEADELKNKLITRILPLNRSEEQISDIKTLYNALTPEFQKSITFEDFKSGFDSLSAETLATFFQSIGDKTKLTYLDLPLRAALTIHASLKSNPWKK